jgi:hypothetical protein
MSLSPQSRELVEKIKKALEDPGISPESERELREEWGIIINGCWLDDEDDEAAHGGGDASP